MDKIPVNALKLSDPLVLLRVRQRQGGPDAMPALCRMLTDLAVNIAFMTSSGLDDPHVAVCCIDPSDRPRVAAGLARGADLSASVDIEPAAVGMLSIYPHQASLAVLGIALQVLEENGLGFHAMASSISALTFVIDWVQLDQAAAVLADAMNLPPGTAALPIPFRALQVPPAL
jgi:aspartokinase